MPVPPAAGESIKNSGKIIGRGRGDAGAIDRDTEIPQRSVLEGKLMGNVVV